MVGLLKIMAQYQHRKCK